MSGSDSDRFLLSYLRALLRLVFGWLRGIWISVRTTRFCLRLKTGRISSEQEWTTLSTKKSTFTNGSVIDKTADKTTRGYEDIPMARGWPLIGTTFDLIAAGSAPYLHKYIDRRHQQFGHIFRERLGTTETVFVSSANLMRSVFLYEGLYPTHPLPDSWVLYNKLHNCQRGLFFMDGHEWHTNRKIMNRILLNGNLDWINVHVKNCTEKLVENWTTSNDKVNGYMKIENLEGQLYRWSIDVICAVMFGSETDSISEQHSLALEEFSRNVHKIFENSANLMAFPPALARLLRMKIWTQFEKDVTKVLQIGYTIIDMHIEQDQSEVLLEDAGLFRKMRAAGMSLEVIKRIFVDLIIAAGDTTAFSSQWALYLMSQDIDMQNKIRTECLGGEADSQTAHGLIKETLRLYPVAPFIGRYLASDAAIGGYTVRKGTMVVLSLYTSGRDSNNFPKPLSVKPERWLRDPSTGELQDVLQAHGTLPFGIGSRSCIGRKLAVNQMHSLVTTIAKHFKLKCFNKEPIDVILRLVAVPNHPLDLGIRPIEE